MGYSEADGKSFRIRFKLIRVNRVSLPAGSGFESESKNKKITPYLGVKRESHSQHFCGSAALKTSPAADSGKVREARCRLVGAGKYEATAIPHLSPVKSQLKMCRE